MPKYSQSPKLGTFIIRPLSKRSKASQLGMDRPFSEDISSLKFYSPSYLMGISQVGNRRDKSKLGAFCQFLFLKIKLTKDSHAKKLLSIFITPGLTLSPKIKIQRANEPPSVTTIWTFVILLIPKSDNSRWDCFGI